jgi:hypothetical protein
VHAELELRGTTMVLKGMHVQDLRPKVVGAANLAVIARMVMERMDLDGLVIKGAVRSPGANPGRRPRDIRFSRRVRAARRA